MSDWPETPLIDLHCHLLPGLDDGPADLGQALALARQAAASGVTVIVATPHYGLWPYTWTRAQFDQALADLRQALSIAGIAVEVRPGCEALLTAELLDHLATAPTLNNSRYLLVELPLQAHTPYLSDLLFALQVRGCWPILAHAERYPVVQQDPAWLVPFIERGLLVQVNAESLVESRSPRLRQTAEWLVRQGLAHILASDAHDAVHRPSLLAAAWRWVAATLGPAPAARLVSEIPAAVLADQPVVVAPPAPARPRRWFAFWGKR